MPGNNPKPIPKRQKPNWWQSFVEKRQIQQKLSSQNHQIRGNKKDINDLSSNKKQTSTRISRNKPRYKEDSKMRVLKPAKGIDLQSYLHSPKAKPSKTMQAVSNFPGFSKVFGGFTLSNRFKKFNYTLLKFKIFSFLNWIIVSILLLGVTGSFIYISFFDQYFLVTNYEVTFGPNSYLEEEEIEAILTRFSTSKTGGVLPENQFWFLNDRNLTISADKAVPEINRVNVKERIWPNKAILEIHTEPILATLSIQENSQRRSWRISQSGRVFTEDKAGLNEQLIHVQRPITYSRLNATFKDYDLEADIDQLNRVWFTNVLWVFFEEQPGVEIISTQFPSMTDTDVQLMTNTGTTLYFSSDFTTIPRQNLESRLRGVFNSTLADEQIAGRIAYIDFRIPSQAVFVCYRNQPCAVK